MSEAKLRAGGVYLDVGLSGNFERIDFRRAPVRKAMDRIGRAVRFRSRRLVARRAVSQAGEYPGIDSGEMLKGIQYKVSKPGFLVIIQPQKTSGMDKFYPAFLHAGAKHRRRGGTLAPRGNFMIDAMNMKRDFIQRELHAALVKGLKD